MEATTSFMSCEESTCEREEVIRALGASDKKLSVQEFVRASGFKIDEMMFNEFWQVVARESCTSHLGGTLLSWLGYEGANDTRKRKFTEFLSRNNISFDQLKSSDPRCADHHSIQEELKSMNAKARAKQQFLIMNSRDFKKAIMKLSTKRGDAIREYYLNVEELLQLYVEYEHVFTTREMMREKNRKISDLERKIDEQTRKIDELLDLNHDQLNQLNVLTEQNNDLQEDVTKIGRQLHVACVDRAPRPLAHSKREKFVVIKWANLNYHKKIGSTKPTDNHRIFRYYAIRAQIPTANKSIRDQREKDAALEIIVEIDIQPNTKTLYNRQKESLREDGVEFIFNHISITNSTVSEAELIERLTEINDDKFNV